MDEAKGGWLWKKDYVWRDGKIAASESPEGRRYYHLDHLGTPRLVTDASGAQVSRHDYFPFGQEFLPTEVTEPIRFTGHEKDFGGMGGPDRAGDLEYMHARYYSSHLGQFLSQDRVDGTPANAELEPVRVCAQQPAEVRGSGWQY